MICDNLSVDSEGILLFANRNPRKLIEKYGSPLYVMDEERIRHNMRTYKNALREAFGENCEVLYASKACSFKEMYRIAKSEDIGVDVVSAGEIYTAFTAGFPMQRAHFHGNNKTNDEIELAIACGVGYFVCDNIDELSSINEMAACQGIRQKVLLRITPGIDAHTFEAVNTGNIDSKFGNAIETGMAEKIVRHALSLKNIDLVGFHCHVGSQVFDSQCFFKCADIMIKFIADMRDKLGYTASELDLGGGYGVRYLESDPIIDIAENIRKVGEHVKAAIQKYALPMPKILLEPGRSIVADAGMTLYTVGNIKKIPNYKNYVAVDGGMTDNPRYALYKAPYTILCPEKMNEPHTFEASVVGKCCESGDILGENVLLPKSVRKGDVLAVLTTGAYNYSMSSNYNRIAKPPVVMLTGDGGSKIVVQRETLADVMRNDV